MIEGHVGEIRDLIGLTRGLCASEALENLHLAAIGALEVLTQTDEIRNRIGLSSLHLWTFCSRQGSSSALIEKDSGHLLIDGFQLDRLSYLLQALTRSPDNRALAVMLPAMLSEIYFIADNIEMADRMLKISIAGMRRFPDATSCLYGNRYLDFQHNVQRVFIIGHEIGHLMLSRRSLAEQVEYDQIIQTRLDHAIRHITTTSTPEQHALPSAMWLLIGKDQRFRNELFCDTIGVEIVEALIADDLTPSSPVGGLAFEAIYFTAVGLDVLRTLRVTTTVDKNLLDEAKHTLLEREFIRGVCLNLLAQNRFYATEAQVVGMVDRIRRAQSDEYGLGHVLAAAEHSSSDVIRESDSNDFAKIRLEKIYQWKSDPAALKTRQIY